MQLPKDKLYHLIAGAVISSGIFIATGSAAWSIWAAAAAGIVKEVWDSFGHGDVEALDAAATCAGGIVACGTLLLLHL